MGELVILVPVLNRPQNIAPLIESVYATTSSVDVLFLASPGDEYEPERVMLQRLGVWWTEVPWAPGDGDYAKKINLGARISRHELIFMGADDLRFHEHWQHFATRKMIGKIKAVGTNDLCNPRVMQRRHSTHTLVHRDYLRRGTMDQRNILLHEGYPHEFCDDEFVHTARKRQVWAHAHQAHVEHLHPLCGKAETDPVYDLQNERIMRGRSIYRKRERLWR